MHRRTVGGGVELYIRVGGRVERGRLAEGFMRGLQMSRGRRIPPAARLSRDLPIPSIHVLPGLYNGVYRCPPTRGYLLLYHRSGSAHDDGRHESEKPTLTSSSTPEDHKHTYDCKFTDCGVVRWKCQFPIYDNGIL